MIDEIVKDDQNLDLLQGVRGGDPRAQRRWSQLCRRLLSKGWDLWKLNELCLTINHQAIFSDDHEHLPEEHRIVEGMWMMFRQNSSFHFIDVIIKQTVKYLWSRQSCPGMEHISYSTQPASSSCQAIMWGSLITSTSSSAKSLSSIMWNSSYHNFILFLCHPYHWNLFHWLQYIFFKIVSNSLRDALGTMQLQLMNILSVVNILVALHKECWCHSNELCYWSG